MKHRKQSINLNQLVPAQSVQRQKSNTNIKLLKRVIPLAVQIYFHPGGTMHFLCRVVTEKI